LLGSLLSLLMVLRHRDNLARLLQGKELRVGDKKTTSSS
jgi:glycerol-3-phosphate acyltransferase PlsY